MPAVTVSGKLHKGRVELNTPIDLPDGSEVYVVAQVGIEKQAAHRKANGWLVDHVGNLVMAGDGALVQSGDRWVWRFHAYLTSASQPPRGPVGEVDVDATTGDVLNAPQTIEMMYARGDRLIGAA
ncbi:MAG: hypothetical protein WDZ49_15840 [Litorilinea sp.]